ncbi:MAG: GNAT family N-acetyltransferase [Rhodobacter sp.]|nr:GNAT family N-acetyltransferase [Rhodobacter sp.]
MPRPEYRFVEVTRADYPLLRRWLAEPHVADTWGEPDDEIALIEQEIDGGDCKMHIVHADTPIGYIQDWDAVTEAHYRDLPTGTRAIDTLLGEPSHLGQGHAKRYVRQYADRLLTAGAPLVATDPRLTNPRGLAMYRAAGFQPHAQRRCETGETVQILTLAPSSG